MVFLQEKNNPVLCNGQVLMNAIVFVQLRMRTTQANWKAKGKQTVETLTHWTSSLLSSWNKFPMTSIGILNLSFFVCPLMALGNTVSR